MSKSYGFCRTIPLAFTDAVPFITRVLENKGFDVQTQIDLQATLKNTLNVDFAPYVILGVYHPDLTYQALQIEPELGLLLMACNVVVIDAGDATILCITDPIQALAPAKQPELDLIADDLNGRLFRVYLDVIVEASKRQHLLAGGPI